MHKINNTYKRIVASVPVRICNYTERGILPQKHYPTFTIYKAPIITPYESKAGSVLEPVCFLTCPVVAIYNAIGYFYRKPGD